MTKSVALRPEAIAFKLSDIFLRFEGLYVLRPDNYSEFCNRDMKDLKTLWPELKTVRGKFRHRESI